MTITCARHVGWANRSCTLPVLALASLRGNCFEDTRFTIALRQQSQTCFRILLKVKGLFMSYVGIVEEPGKEH